MRFNGKLSYTRTSKNVSCNYPERYSIKTFPFSPLSRTFLYDSIRKDRKATRYIASRQKVDFDREYEAAENHFTS